MHRRFKCSLPKGFAHTHSVSKLNKLQGADQFDDLQVRFADSCFTYIGNYLHQLEKTSEPYLVAAASFTLVSANPDDPDPYSLSLYPVRLRELTVIRASIDPLISELLNWISKPRPETWSIHRHKFEIWFDPATEELRLVEKSSPPSDLRS